MFSSVYSYYKNLQNGVSCLNHILKESQIPKGLQIIREKADTVLISAHLSFIAESFKVAPGEK